MFKLKITEETSERLHEIRTFMYTINEIIIK